MRHRSWRSSSAASSVTPGRVLLDVGGLHPVRQRRLGDPEVLRDLLQRGPGLAATGDRDHVVAELLRIGSGHGDILSSGAAHQKCHQLLHHAHLPVRLPAVLGGAGQGPEPIYQAPTAAAAAAAVGALEEKWGTRYPAMIRLWRNTWSEFIPFLDYDVEIRRVLYSTNAIESLNARFRRAVRARGHFPNEQSAMKTLYLVVRSLDPKGTGQTRWASRWKPALNAFAITFADRIPAAENH